MPAGKLLLDTHTWIWYAEGSPELGQNSRNVIARAIKAGSAFVSVVSYREVGVLAQKGKIRLAYDTRKWVREATVKVGVGVIELRRLMVLESLTLMNSMTTRDPFDHMIVATAIRCKAALVSADQPIRDFGATGQVAVLDART